MEKKEFFALMNLVPVFDSNFATKEQTSIISSGNDYILHLPLNHFAPKPLNKMNLLERLEFFSKLHDSNFVFERNDLYCGAFELTFLHQLIKEKYGLENIYQFDNFYIKKLLEGHDLFDDDILIGDNQFVTLGSILEHYVFRHKQMCIDESPNLNIMLTVKKALIGTILAYENVERIKLKKEEIYDVLPLS